MTAQQGFELVPGARHCTDRLRARPRQTTLRAVDLTSKKIALRAVLRSTGMTYGG